MKRLLESTPGCRAANLEHIFTNSRLMQSSVHDYTVDKPKLKCLHIFKQSNICLYCATVTFTVKLRILGYSTFINFLPPPPNKNRKRYAICTLHVHNITRYTRIVQQCRLHCKSLLPMFTPFGLQQHIAVISSLNTKQFNTTHYKLKHFLSLDYVMNVTDMRKWFTHKFFVV